MSTLKFSFLFSLVFFLFHSTRSTIPACDKRYCGNSELQQLFEFPFLLREENHFTNNQSDRCGYPGFEIFCNNKNQALLTLSNSREFVVKFISLERRRIWVNDPNECPPKRFLQNIFLNNDSPFQLDNTYHSNYENVTFVNCTGFTKEPVIHDDDFIIPCLSNEKYTIMYTLQSPIDLWINRSCHEIGFAMVPVKDNSSEPRVIMEGLYSDILLRWNKPLCDCAADQFCGFETDTGLDVTCYDYNDFNQPGGNPSNPRHKNMYFFPVVWGISGALFFIWVIVSICKDRRQNHIQQNQTITNIESNNGEPPWFVFGLDRSRIEEYYPKIQVAESGQLPKSIDNVCSICLSEYKPMETLRSMPQCNHYFHADCIDVWLKMNATCPLCRNLPE